MNAMSEQHVKCLNCGFLGKYALQPMWIQAGTELNTWQQLKDLGMLDPDEWTQELRDKWAENPSADLPNLTCVRHVWGYSNLKTKERNEVFNFLNSERKCPFFFPYNGGYSPAEHRELQREAKTHSLLIKGMLWAAVIGAVIGALITALINILVSGH